MVKFIADSSCDMLEMEGVNFESVPLTISTDEKSWTDDETMDVHDMIETLAEYKGRSYTACPSVEAWLKAYEGADELYVGTLTSTISGTYNSALVASELYLENHPDAKIHVFDTLSTSAELRLLMEKLVSLKEKDYSFDQVVEMGIAYLKTTRLFFAFQSLHNFAQNGRINKAVAAAIGVLGIRIVGTASEGGEIEPLSKVRGDKKALDELMKQLEAIGFSKGKVRIGHTENPELAQTLADKIAQKYPLAKIKIYPARGLCSYYGENGAIFLGVEAI